MEPIRITLGARSQALGWAIYLLGAPALGAFLGLMTSAFVCLGLEALKVPEPAIVPAGVAVLGVVFAGSIYWAIRDFRRRKAVEVAVFFDRLEVVRGGRRREIAFAEVEGIRLGDGEKEPELILHLACGDRIRFPKGLAFEELAAALDPLLLDKLREDMDRRVAGDGSFPLRESALAAWGRIVRGALQIFAAPLLVITLKVHAALEAVKGGIYLIAQGWRGRGGGFEFGSQGIVARGGVVVRRIPWEDLELVEASARGLALRSKRTRAHVQASRYALNFWPAVGWFKARLSSPAP